jgi:hypothetical protein
MRATLREQFDYYCPFRLPQLCRYLALIPWDHPVVEILNVFPSWVASFMSEYMQAVDNFVRQTAARLHRLRLSYSLSQPDNSPPPPHLISKDLPDGPASCGICSQSYLSDSQVVVLECQEPHHFHRSCLSVSLILSLLPRIQSDPIRSLLLPFFLFFWLCLFQRWVYNQAKCPRCRTPIR